MATAGTELKPRLQWIDDPHPELVATLSRKANPRIEDAMDVKFIGEFMDTTDHIPKVLLLDDEVVGYNFYILHKKVVTIHQFAVAFDYRRKGLGRYMIESLQRSLPGLRRRIIATEVCEYNKEAHLFLQACHFEWCKTLKKPDEPARYVFKYAS